MENDRKVYTESNESLFWTISIDSRGVEFDNSPSDDRLKPGAHARKQLTKMPREVVCPAVSSRVRRPLNRWLSDLGSGPLCDRILALSSFSRKLIVLKLRSRRNEFKLLNGRFARPSPRKMRT